MNQITDSFDKKAKEISKKMIDVPTEELASPIQRNLEKWVRYLTPKKGLFDYRHQELRHIHFKTHFILVEDPEVDLEKLETDYDLDSKIKIVSYRDYFDEIWCHECDKICQKTDPNNLPKYKIPVIKFIMTDKKKNFNSLDPHLLMIFQYRTKDSQSDTRFDRILCEHIAHEEVDKILKPIIHRQIRRDFLNFP